MCTVINDIKVMKYEKIINFSTMVGQLESEVMPL